MKPIFYIDPSEINLFDDNEFESASIYVTKSHFDGNTVPVYTEQPVDYERLKISAKQRELELLAVIETMIEAANCIKHWHDWGKEDEGMVVSHDSVIHLWEVAASADVAIHGEDKSQALREHEAKVLEEAAEAKLREFEMQEPVAYIHQAHDGLPVILWNPLSKISYRSMIVKYPDIPLYVKPFPAPKQEEK